MRRITHLIDAKSFESTSGNVGPVYNPATGEQTGEVDLASVEEVDLAVQSSKNAFQEWGNVSIARRVKLLHNFRNLVIENEMEIASRLTEEHGKVSDDARGEVARGIENIEFACGFADSLKGTYSEHASTGVDVYTVRQPLGVCAGITPFNFPAMVPLWMIPNAVACGNTFVLKPSERDPSAPRLLIELAQEAGFPSGVVNLVNGDKTAVDRLLEHPDISAVSFVGSTPIAKYVYSTGTSKGKRVQALGGAKNHMLVLPDADLDLAADAAVSAAYGSAGERCMAISVALPVGKETGDKLIEKLVPRIESLKIGPYTSENEVDFGPVVTKQAQQRILSLVDSGVKSGADLVVDGRNFKMQGYENGFFVGACLFDNVKTDMDIYKQEIFGPVLSTVRTESYEQAMSIAMNNEYGNGTAIFTRDGDTARDFANRINIGMVGINVPIPVPLAYHTFGGWKKSAFGDLNQHGPDAFRFYTRTKTITSRWPTGIKEGAKFSIPTMD